MSGGWWVGRCGMQGWWVGGGGWGGRGEGDAMGCDGMGWEDGGMGWVVIGAGGDKRREGGEDEGVGWDGGVGGITWKKQISV